MGTVLFVLRLNWSFLTMPNYPVFDQPSTLFLPLWAGLGCDMLASIGASQSFTDNSWCDVIRFAHPIQ